MQNNPSKKRPKYFVLLLTLCLLGLAFYLYNYVLYLNINDVKVCSQVFDFKSKFSGEITKINVIPGTEVKKGQIIAQVNSSIDEDSLGFKKIRLAQVNNDLNEACANEKQITQSYLQDKMSVNDSKNNYNSAIYDYNRYRNAYRDGAVTRRDVKNAKFNLKFAKSLYTDAKNRYKISSENYYKMASKRDSIMAEINLLNKEIKKLEFDLVNTVLTSDIDGTIDKVLVDVGSSVQTGDVIATIASSNIYLEANVTSKNVKIGDIVEISIKNSKNKYTGTIKDITGADKKLARINFNGDSSRYNIEPTDKISIRIRML